VQNRQLTSQRKPKPRYTRRQPRPKTQHDKFVEAAKRLGADESENAFARTLKKIAPKPRKDDR
jgi:hypothetical protein